MAYWKVLSDPSHIIPQAAGATDLIGPGEPPGQAAQADDAEDVKEGAAPVLDVPACYTVDVATR